MKREYQKPMLYGESFELAEHITSPCSPMGKANHRSADSCGYDNGDGEVVFLDGVTKCTSGDPFGGLLNNDELTGQQTEDCYGGYFMEGAVIFSS